MNMNKVTTLATNGHLLPKPRASLLSFNDMHPPTKQIIPTLPSAMPTSMLGGDDLFTADGLWLPTTPSISAKKRNMK